MAGLLAVFAMQRNVLVLFKDHLLTAVQGGLVSGSEVFIGLTRNEVANELRTRIQKDMGYDTYRLGTGKADSTFDLPCITDFNLTSDDDQIKRSLQRYELLRDTRILMAQSVCKGAQNYYSCEMEWNENNL